MNRFWTQKEEEFLKLNYPVHGIRYCMEHLNKSEDGVKHKARKLGVKAKGRLLSNEDYLLRLKDRDIKIIPLEPYINAKIKIKHQCTRGHIWLSTPDNILANRGCSTCSGHIKKTTEEYQAQIKYTVLEPYVNAITKILHRCDRGHEWRTTPSIILEGCGCPICASTGFNPNAPAIFYYIKISFNNETYYKIGITNRTVQDRFFADQDKTIKIIWQEYYEIGLEAKTVEKELLDFYKDKRVNMDKWLKSGGNTELFEYDVLGLDN